MRQRHHSRGFPTKTATLKRRGKTDKAGVENWTEIGDITVHVQGFSANLLLAAPGTVPMTMRKVFTFDSTDIFEGDVLVFTSGSDEVHWTVTLVRPFDGNWHHKELDLEGPHYYEPD